MTSLALACKLGTAAAISQLPTRVKRILRKYGATLFMPGPAGILQYGFQPGNYRESTGQNLAAVDQQVGLVVDAARSPGPELVTGDSSTFDTGVGSWVKTGAALLSASGGIASVTNGVNYSDKAELSISESSGKTLAVEVDVWVSSGTARVSLRQAVSPFAEVAFVLVSNTARTRLRLVGLSPSGNLNVQIVPWSGSAGQFVYFDTVSVRELHGIHASQATSGYQPVLRYAPIIGADLLADWDFLSADAWQANGAASLSVGAGVGTATFSAGSNYPTVLQYCTTEVGKTYEVEIRAKKTTTDTVRFLVGATSVNITDSYNTYRLSYQAVAASTLCRVQVAASSALAGSFEIDYFRVREIIGYDSRTQSWQFDGTDDRLSLSAMPFEMTDDFFAVFGYRAAVAADVNLLTLRNTGLTNPVIALGILPNGAPRFWARNDVGTFVQTQGVPRVGVDTVLSGRKYLATMECRVEGTLAQSAVRPANALTVNNATICASVSTGAGGFFNGNLHGAILGKGAITEAELLTLEKFIAKLQGRSL